MSFSFNNPPTTRYGNEGKHRNDIEANFLFRIDAIREDGIICIPRYMAFCL